MTAQRFRPSAKAVVVDRGRVLVTRNRTPGDDDDWYCLPGGGQHTGETVIDALRREVEEETGLLIEPVRLLWVRELIVALRPELPFNPEEHVIEFMFESRIIGGDGDPRETDVHQVGVEWMTGDQLGAVRFYPEALVVPIVDLMEGRSTGPVYIGDVD